VSPSDPAARWTGARGDQAFFAHSTNYLVDVENAIILDVEATTAIRQAEVLAAKRMIERSLERFDLYPRRLSSMPTPCGKDGLPPCVAQAPQFPPKRKLSIRRSRSIRSISGQTRLPIVETPPLLRLNGRLVQGALAPRSAVGRAIFQRGFRLYENSQIEGLLTSAHFANVSIETINETVNPPMGGSRG
jgi:hypothetical protein